MGRKIVRVDENEFELEDGRVFPHIEKLEVVPSIEEFQKMYDYWISVFEEKGLIDKSR